MHFPEGSRGQQKPSATVKPVEVKQCITKCPQYRNKWKTYVLSKKKLADDPTYRYLFVYIYTENGKNQLA